MKREDVRHWYNVHLDARNIQQRVADAITAFCGSMTFVYLHAAIFAVWCYTGLWGNDPYPFNFLTMAVSLEAIFLSTFVMIGQNNQSKRDRAQADADYATNLAAKEEIEALARKLSGDEISVLTQILEKISVLEQKTPTGGT